MKKIFLLVAISFLSGCFNIEGDDVAFIYPKEDIANVRQFAKSCPVKVTQPKTVPLSELEGWVCIPPEKAAEYRREYENDCN